MAPALIQFDLDKPVVPSRPFVACLPGDGIGPEVWAAARPVLDRAVEAASGGCHAISWVELPLGESALATHGSLLPQTTLEGLARYRVAIKGPTATPVGGGHKSLNVTLRQVLDLYANVRPVRYFPGVVAPVVHPEKLDVVIFRENTEDVYSGIEFHAGSEGAGAVAQAIAPYGFAVADDAGVGIKLISRTRTRRLVRAAIRYAIHHRRRVVTLVHKGNIMKATEGAFRNWAYELAREEFSDQVVCAPDLPRGARAPEGKLPAQGGGAGAAPGGGWGMEKVLVEDRIADAMFQDLLLKPAWFDVIAAPNLDGDYLSDAAAAQVGGLGLAPGANLGDAHALFESTHGTAPDIAGQGLANPGSMMLSGAMMLDYLGWPAAADRVRKAIAAVLASGRMTRDLAQGRADIEVLSTSQFSQAVVDAIQS